MDCFRWLWQAKRLATVDTLKFVRRKMSQTRPGPVEVAFTCMFLVFMRERETETETETETHRERLTEKERKKVVQGKQLTISFLDMRVPELLSCRACWCFFPRRWLSRYTSDGICQWECARCYEQFFITTKQWCSSYSLPLQALASHCLKHWNNPGTCNTAGSEIMVLSFH